MDEIQKVNEITLVRIDKNIAKCGSDFALSFGKEAQLIFDIVIYLANCYQNNLFNYESFDIAAFAKKLGYSVSNLKRKLKPEELHNSKQQINSEDSSLNFDSVIENALYKATAQSLVFTKVVKDYTNNEKTKTIESYLLISSLTKHVSEKRKDCFYYTFSISETLLTHLTKFFTLADISCLKALRKKNSIYLYFYLKILEENQRSNEKDKVHSYPYFDILCREAEIDVKSPSESKRKLSIKLKHIQENTNLNFKFRFYKRSGKHSYGVELTFPDNASYLSIDKKNQSNIIVEKATNHAVKDACIKYYREKYQKSGRLNESKFKLWFYNSLEDLQEKYDIYYKVYADRRKQDIEEIKKYKIADARRFFKATV